MPQPIIVRESDGPRRRFAASQLVAREVLAGPWGRPECSESRWPVRLARSGPMSELGGDLNRSTQHLLILPDQEVCAWMHGPGSRRSRKLSSVSAGRAVNV